MSTQTAPSQSFARFTRGALGLSSRQRESKKISVEEDDWYIPYNGPYEAPREQPRKQRARDSWGDLVDDDGEEDYTVLADRELHLRYGGHRDFDNRNSTSRPVDDERKGRSRDRALSVISGRTTSSGAVDPTRGSLTIHRRSTVSGNPPPIPSYINLDAMGGVGESPVPHVRQGRDTNRISLASIFSFGIGRNRAPSPARSDVGRKSSTRLLKPISDGPYGPVESPTSPRRDSSSSGSQRRSDGVNKKHLYQTDQTSLIVTDEEDYYNSYYSTLLKHDDANRTHPYQPRSPSSSGASHTSALPQQRQVEGLSRQNSNSTASPHPYAYAFPRIEIPSTPHTAPPTPAPRNIIPTMGNNVPRLTLTTAQQKAIPSTSNNNHGNNAPQTLSPRSAGGRSLKNSTSTPDLRTQTLLFGKTTTIPNHEPPTTPSFQFPKGLDRWLSPETWCDAVLFPRPRLRLKQESMEGPKQESSGRIVSPPATPTSDDFGFGSQQQQQQKYREPGIASRVLANSRSMVDLHKGKRKREEIQHAHPSTSKDPQTSRAGEQSTSKPPRPKSFAWDDLALPTPVPSLAHVLRDGELLERQRRDWQYQATHSFGNKHARSMSRTRSKSLTQKGRGQHHHQSSMEYIAARACLGSQNLTPVIAPPKFNASFTDTNGTTTTSSRFTHSHSNSLVKTLTKSSKAHSRTHSRNDSWGKSAMKVAKSTVLCGFDNDSSVHVAKHRPADLEGALKGNETKVIRLADPALLPLDRGNPLQPYQPTMQRQTPSPAMSGISDSKVGIALGTPPEEEADYLPNHPYAQGGFSFSHNAGSSGTEQIPRHSDFAGPHPSIITGGKAPAISEIIARHKLPPHMVLHPYAQTSRDSYLDANGLVGQFRSDDNTPHATKMWAQLSPGVVREVLPNDLQYSPFSPDRDRLPGTPDRQTIVINDTIGVGETLVNASRFRVGEPKDKAMPDSGSNDPQPPRLTESPQPAWDEAEEHDILPELNSVSRRHGIQYGLSRSGDSNLDVNVSFERAQSASSGNTSATSSPRTLPKPLGSPNDLNDFQDLFYRPTGSAFTRTPNEAALPETPSPPNRSSIPWEMNMPNRRTGSSLTSLARKLSEEFEMISQERDRSSSQYSQSPTSSQRPTRPSRRPTESSLQFLFEELASTSLEAADPIQAFRPSGALPEDVQAESRASSYIENTDEDDETARFRMGQVESVSTPPPVTSTLHPGLDGQMAFVHNDKDPLRQGESQPRLTSALQPPNDPMRISYMTTSTLSRMSGLSDFPAPPKDDDYSTMSKHRSMLSSYFDEALAQTESADVPLPTRYPLLEEHRVTFGSNQNANDLVKTLSST